MLFNRLESMRTKLRDSECAADFNTVLKKVLMEGGSLGDVRIEMGKRLADVQDFREKFEELQREYREAGLQWCKDECKRRDEEWEQTIIYETAVCLITKDENDYLEEWVRHHLSVGFDHLFIYDNSSKIPVKKTIEGIEGIDYNRITVESMPSRKDTPIQYFCYNKFLRDHGRLCKYVAFIDTDEFIDIRDSPSVKALLPRYTENHCFGALHLNWELYDADNQILKENGTLFERFKSVSVYKKVPYLGKIIARVSRIRTMHLHHCDFYEGSVTLNTQGNPFRPQKNWENDGGIPVEENEIAVVRHYFTKSLEEWVYKVLRGNCSYYFHRKLTEFLEYNPRMRDIFDRVCLRVFGEGYAGQRHKYQETLDIEKSTVRAIIEEESKLNTKDPDRRGTKKKKLNHPKKGAKKCK